MPGSSRRAALYMVPCNICNVHVLYRNSVDSKIALPDLYTVRPVSLLDFEVELVLVHPGNQYPKPSQSLTEPDVEDTSSFLCTIVVDLSLLKYDYRYRCQSSATWGGPGCDGGGCSGAERCCLPRILGRATLACSGRDRSSRSAHLSRRSTVADAVDAVAVDDADVVAAEHTGGDCHDIDPSGESPR
eukprot:CAMPEP_0114295244 /NCGR_PEP_ID=MMETSP0059-20121206/10577_1 /TAXON_ID=36894 /ORGANISM="Pyramimonas parkeae, Strain CCMP726" /LENGTH=186 /DNA_ID=CAMNT_0001417117 /DNA_START=113 /DNA_END=674 /DNA_ORIENTATION=-